MRFLQAFPLTHPNPHQLLRIPLDSEGARGAFGASPSLLAERLPRSP